MDSPDSRANTTITTCFCKELARKEKEEAISILELVFTATSDSGFAHNIHNEMSSPRLKTRRRSTAVGSITMEDPEDCTSPPVLDPEPSARGPFTRNDILKLPQEFRNLLAGGVAGMTAKSFVAPIDRIKILYQVSSARFHLSNVPRVAYNIIHDEGLSALWKGNAATMIRVFPYSGIQFMVFDRCKTYMLRLHQEQRSPGDERAWGLSAMESLIAGCIAGCVSVVCTYPLDLTRAQLAVLKRKKHHTNVGFRQVLYQNYEQRGFVGLFRGCTPTLLGILPYAGIAYAMNEQGKRKILNVTGREPTVFEKMQCGALSGLVAQTISYPLEVTRRRMQTIGIVPTHGGDSAINELGVKDTGRHLDRPASMINTMRLLFQEQGIRGMFKGVTMNWMKGPLAFSISFTAFDIAQSFLATEEEQALRKPHHKG